MESSGDGNWTIELDAADARIEGSTVLQNISWRLRAGEHWGIVGPNGSGKTALLNLISGRLWPAPGRGRRRYRFDDRIWTDATEAGRRITSVGPELQNRYARLSWNFSVLDVILTGIFHSEIPRRTASNAERLLAERILDEFDLGGLSRRRFLELSRGEQRRVLIARGVAFGPDVLLLDEPASGLDAAARARLEETIERASVSTTIIATAHSMDQLPAVVDHYLELRGGRIVASGRLEAGGEPEHARRSPLSLDEMDEPGAEPEDPLVVVRNADVWLGGRRVLENIDWTLMPREHWLVTGDNGAGKTSFLRLLHGQLRPALGGEVSWPALGNPGNIWALRRQIGWVAPELQAAYRFPTTAYECIASGFRSSIGLTHRLSEAEREQTLALLERFELDPFRDRRLDTLSYGQLRRVLIARTLAVKPRLLLLDEPWEGLDPGTIDAVRRELQREAANGTQLVCISHGGDMGLGFTQELELVRGRIDRAGARAARRAGAGASPRENSTSAPSPARDCRSH